jgi:predicted permease
MLLVAQMGLAVVLLVATGLVVRSFSALRQIDLGFTPDRVLTATVQPRGATEPPNVWLDRFLDRVRSLPDVQAAGAVYLRPLMLGPIGQGVRVTLEGQPDTQAGADLNPTLNHQIATPGYFETMGIPLRRGRFFTDQDAAGRPRVAIVSESTAARLWPGRDPIGQRLMIATFTPGGPARDWRTVVGVVSNVRYRALDEVQLDVYDPALQVGRPADTVVVRTAGQPLAAAAALRALAREMDAGAIVDSITSMDAVVARAQAPWRLTTWMFLLFGGFAFALAALGLFSLVALDVAHRGREFAIRMTLGASRAALLGSVLRRAGWRVLAGVTGGIVVARLAARSMRSVLFGIAPDDAVTYLSVIALVLAVVAFAACIPALRALRSDPQALLRQE